MLNFFKNYILLFFLFFFFLFKLGKLHLKVLKFTRKKKRRRKREIFIQVYYLYRFQKTPLWKTKVWKPVARIVFPFPIYFLRRRFCRKKKFFFFLFYATRITVRFNGILRTKKLILFTTHFFAVWNLYLNKYRHHLKAQVCSGWQSVSDVVAEVPSYPSTYC